LPYFALLFGKLTVETPETPSNKLVLKSPSELHEFCVSAVTFPAFLFTCGYA